MKGCYLIYFLFFLISVFKLENAIGQDNSIVETDTIKVKEIRPKSDRVYDPDRAALLSAIVPGLGQVYNRQYWKLPFVYGGVGALYYFFQFNNRYYKSYRNARINLANPNANLEVYKKLQEQIDALPNQNNLDGQLERGEAEYRRRRDLTIILACASYGIIIVDAYINAHLKAFTITKDLSFKVKPSLQPTLMAGTSTGIAFNLTFK